MRIIRIFLILSLCSSLCQAQNADAPQPKLSSEALTAEQIAIYQVILKEYADDPEGALNLAK